MNKENYSPSLLHLKSFLNEGLNHSLELIKSNYKGEALSDDEVEECIIVLSFVAKFTSVSPMFGLMKREMHSEIERLEKIKMARGL